MAQLQKFLGIIIIAILFSFCSRYGHIESNKATCEKPYGIMIVNPTFHHKIDSYDVPFTLLIGNVLCSDTSPWIVKSASKGYSQDSFLEMKTKGYYWFGTAPLLYPYNHRNTYMRDTGKIKLIEFTGFGDIKLLNSSLIELIIQHKDSLYHIDCDVYKQDR